MQGRLLIKKSLLKPHTFLLVVVGDLCNLKFCDDNSEMILIFQLLICQHQSSQLNGMPLLRVCGVWSRSKFITGNSHEHLIKSGQRTAKFL